MNTVEAELKKLAQKLAAQSEMKEQERDKFDRLALDNSTCIKKTEALNEKIE